MKPQAGFTLIELLIVVAIILIVAAIAVPSLVQSKINANEASAVASLRTINTSQASYQNTYPNKGYAASLAALGGPFPCVPSPDNACLIDENLTAGSKAGYEFAVTAEDSGHGTTAGYLSGAAPTNFRKSGIHWFCSSESNVIREDDNAGGSTTPPNMQQCVGFKPI